MAKAQDQMRRRTGGGGWGREQGGATKDIKLIKSTYTSGFISYLCLFINFLHTYILHLHIGVQDDEQQGLASGELH